MQGDAIAFMRTLNLIHLFLRDQQRVRALVSTSKEDSKEVPGDDTSISRGNQISN